MQIGKVVRKVEMPEKGVRAGHQKYPFDEVVVGGAFMIQADVEDGLTLAKMKKRVTEAVRQYERRVGKTKGVKTKDFAVWIDEAQDGVWVGLRTDLSPKGPVAYPVDKLNRKAEKKPAPMKKPAPAKSKVAKAKQKQTVSFVDTQSK
jgi:hypothetical protein